MASCSTVHYTDRDLPDLTLSEIENKLEQYAKYPEQNRQYFDDKALIREKNLIPMDILIKSLGELGLQKSKNRKTDKIDFDLQCPTLPRSVDLRKYDSPVQDQWNGTCTAFATMATLENYFCRHFNWCGKLSEKHQWANQKYNCSNEYSTDCAQRTIKKYPVAESKYWPQSSSKPEVYDIDSKGIAKLLNAPEIDDNIDQMKCALANGYPVLLAMKTPKSMLSCVDVIDPNSDTSGGHAIAIVGYKESEKYGTLALIKNSWGDDCGMEGYQYLPVSLFFKNGFYAYMWPILDAELKGYDPTNPDPVTPTPDDKLCVEWEKYWCGGSKWYKLYLPWRKCEKCVKWAVQ
jgi:hypothetical protein